MGELDFRFAAIRRHYQPLTPLILAERSDEWAIDAYSWDTPSSGIRLSPIERALWADIRQQNLVMYPQYPVAGYFVDFANPVAKVAIECDGAAFHVDAAKDAARQRHIEAKGWSVYRISGADCMRDEAVHVDADGHEVVTSSAAWQFMERISRLHHIKRCARESSGPRRASDSLREWMTRRIQNLGVA